MQQTLYELFDEYVTALDPFSAAFDEARLTSDRRLTISRAAVDQYGIETIDEWCRQHGWDWQYTAPRRMPSLLAWLRR